MKQIVCTCCFLLVFAPATVFAQGAVGALQTGSIEQRIDAMLNIGYARNRAGFWYLVKYLEYDRAEEETATAVRLRVAAAESLGRLNDERAIPHLVERFGKEQSPEVKARILFALGMYRDERARQVIAGALDDKSEDIRYQAVVAAAGHQHPDFYEKLKAIAGNDSDAGIRLAGAFALCRAGVEQQKYGPMLVDTLQSKDPLMRFYAASYLGRSDYLRAVQPLAAAAEIENHPWVQNEMARSLVILRKEISFRRERARDSYRFIEPNSERKADSPQPVRP